ncbi:MAG: radical SAM protein [Clostridiales bacterium]|nr:radical SAM protein [Clostridiales bacterium]
MKSKHINLALFVPHQGCPRHCVFCNQHTVTGKEGNPLKAKDIDAAVQAAQLDKISGRAGREIAFFGGSFTAIDPDYMSELLERAHKYVKSGLFDGIRISTRPDAIDSEVCQTLKRYGVATIELGAQSMDDRVLAKNRRGHTAARVIDAAQIIHGFGFDLGLQMMVGLHGSSGAAEALDTAKKLAALKPRCVRIYPTLILKETELEKLYLQGDYKPLPLNLAIDICADLLEFFDKKNIDVIRLGLHSSTLPRGFVAGPHHPAFGELCRSALYLRSAMLAIENMSRPTSSVLLTVAKNAVSQMVGQERSNIKNLESQGYSCRVVGRDGLGKYEVLASARL